MNGRLDGHIVQGHVDQTAVCTAVQENNGSWYYTFSYSVAPEMAAQGYVTVEKGSVCVNGVSLTVVNSRTNGFSVAIIPFTREHTNFDQIVKDSVVNIEFDIVGKYLSRMVMARNGREFFVTGHSEYAPNTLDQEYKRDLAKGASIEVPQNYYRDNDPSKAPLVRWRGHGRKLRVVCAIHTLVTEVAREFVYPFKTAHDKTFEVQLIGDTQVQRNVQRVVVRDERTSRSAARNRLQYRSVHFHVTLFVEEVTHVIVFANIVYL